MAGIGLAGQEADSATFRAGPIQRALRAAQHLDTVKIDQAGCCCPLVAAGGDQRHFVDIDAHCGVADRGADAANGDILLPGAAMGRKGNAGYDSGNILNRLNPMLQHGRAINHANAGWHLLQAFRTLAGRHDDVAELSRVAEASLNEHVELKPLVLRRWCLSDLARRDLNVLFADRRENILHRQIASLECVRIDPDPHPVRPAADHLDIADPLDTRQSIFDTQGREVAQVQIVVKAIG